MRPIGVWNTIRLYKLERNLSSGSRVPKKTQGNFVIDRQVR